MKKSAFVVATALLLISAPTHAAELRSPPIHVDAGQGQVCMFTLLGKARVDVEYGYFQGGSILFKPFGAVEMVPNETRSFPMNFSEGPVSCAVRAKVNRRRIQITACATDGFQGDVVACVSGP